MRKEEAICEACGEEDEEHYPGGLCFDCYLESDGLDNSGSESYDE